MLAYENCELEWWYELVSNKNKHAAVCDWLTIPPHLLRRRLSRSVLIYQVPGIIPGNECNCTCRTCDETQQFMVVLRTV